MEIEVKRGCILCSAKGCSWWPVGMLSPEVQISSEFKHQWFFLKKRRIKRSRTNGTIRKKGYSFFLSVMIDSWREHSACQQDRVSGKKRGSLQLKNNTQKKKFQKMQMDKMKLLSHVVALASVIQDQDIFGSCGQEDKIKIVDLYWIHIWIHLSFFMEIDSSIFCKSKSSEANKRIL